MAIHYARLDDGTRWAIQPTRTHVTTVEPPDWATNCTNYVDANGSAVSSGTAWRSGTYYFSEYNWYPIFIPGNGLKVEHTNLTTSDTGRTQSGGMYIGWIRRNIVKVNLAYTLMSGADLRYMYDLLQGEEYTMRYYDLGSVYTASAYTGDMSYTFDSYGQNGESVYTDCEMHMIGK